jgi:hypothetical protein
MIKNLIIATSEAKCEEIYEQIWSLNQGRKHTLVRSGSTEDLYPNHDKYINSNHVDVFVFPGNGFSPKDGKLTFLPNAVFIELPNGNVVNVRDRESPSGFVVCKVSVPFWKDDKLDLIKRFPIVTAAVKASLPRFKGVIPNGRYLAMQVFLELHFKELTIENREEL